MVVVWDDPNVTSTFPKSNQQKNNIPEKECYYYYVYRKRIDPSTIKSTQDLPIPLIFRRSQQDFNVANIKLKSPPNSPLYDNYEFRKRSTSVPPNITRNLSDGNQRGKRAKSSTGSAKSVLSPSIHKGLQWSRHSTIITVPEGAKEKTVKTETNMTFTDGKWIEETVQTTTITDENGHVTTTHKTSTREIEKDAPESPKSKTPSPKTIVSDKKKSSKLEEQTVKALDNQETFSKQMLRLINNKRKIHDASPLIRSEKLTKLAKIWADRLAKDGTMEHTERQDIGENIYLRNSTEPWFQAKPQDVVENWYKEVSHHNFSQEPTPGVIASGHFTQMVWKETTELGVAFARSANGKLLFVVAFFSPKGNWIGEFSKNVLPAGGTPTTNTLRGSGAEGKSTNHFNQKCLESHNQYRAKHGVPPLKLDRELTNFAMKWAKELARINKMEHFKNNKYGENLYTVWSSDKSFTPTPEEGVKSWYSEIQDYNFNKEKNDPKTGHFTQLVWKNTKLLGVGKAQSKSGTWYIVAEYYPPGNYLTQYKLNVMKPIS